MNQQKISCRKCLH